MYTLAALSLSWAWGEEVVARVVALLHSGAGTADKDSGCDCRHKLLWGKDKAALARGETALR